MSWRTMWVARWADSSASRSIPSSLGGASRAASSRFARTPIQHIGDPVVGDAGRGLSDRFELLRLPELLVADVAVGHVDHGAERDAADDRGLHHDPTRRAVGADDAVVVLPVPLDHPLGDPLARALAILGVDEGDVGLASVGRGAGREAEDRAERVLPPDLVGLRVPAPEPDADGLDRHPELGLARPQRLLGAVPRGRVARDAEHGDDRAVAAPERLEQAIVVVTRAVGQDLRNHLRLDGLAGADARERCLEPFFSEGREHLEHGLADDLVRALPRETSPIARFQSV